MTAKITSGQRKQIKRFVEDGLDSLNLTKEDAQSLIAQGGVFQAQLKEAVVALLKKGKFPSQTFAASLIPNGWEIVEDVEPSKFQVKDLETVSFLENGEEYVKGDVLRKRAVGLTRPTSASPTRSTSWTIRRKFRQSSGPSTSCSRERCCAIPAAT